MLPISYSDRSRRTKRPLATSHRNASEIVLLGRPGTEQPSASTPAATSGTVSGVCARKWQTQIACRSCLPASLSAAEYRHRSKISPDVTAIVAQTLAEQRVCCD
jgi:hypothetical protein